MPDRPRGLDLTDLRRDPRLYDILLEHAYRGIRVQLLLRGALVVFVAVTVIAVPPLHYRVACEITAGLYALWAAAVVWMAQRGGERPVRFIWLALFGDVLVLGVLSLLASASEQSWTTDVLVNGFFLIPMLATTQLRPGVGTAVTAPAVAVYLGSLVAAQHANSEPWASIILRTGVLAALSLGCVLLSQIQRSRVLTIAGLISDRTRLMGDLVNVETRARQDLAEELHDGALQYVLAARQDLEDARRYGDAESFDRIEFALRESSGTVAFEGQPTPSRRSGKVRPASRARGPGSHHRRAGRLHGRSHNRRMGGFRQDFGRPSPVLSGARAAGQCNQARSSQPRARRPGARKRPDSAIRRRRRRGRGSGPARTSSC